MAGTFGQEVGVSGLAHYAVIVVTVGAITLVSHWFLLRTKPRELAEGGGRIVPDRRAIGTGVVAGLLLSAIGCTALWYGALVPGSLMAAAGLGGALLVALSLSHRHDVIWSGMGIEGPCAMFWGILGSARMQIRWSEIARTGRTVSGYSFVETAGGRRIYWSSLYSGFAVFENSLKLHRPDLFNDQATRRRAETTTLGTARSRSDLPSRPIIAFDAEHPGADDRQLDRDDGA